MDAGMDTGTGTGVGKGIGIREEFRHFIEVALHRVSTACCHSEKTTLQY